MISTQTKVDISTVKLPDNLNDDFFKRSKPEKRKDGDIFSDSKKVCCCLMLYSLTVNGLFMYRNIH